MICISHKGRKAVNGRTQCKLCLDKMKIRYAKARKSGICVHHPLRTAIPGQTECLNCQVKRKIARLRKHGLSKRECAIAAKALFEFRGVCQSCCCRNHGGKGWHTDHDDKTKR